MSDVQTSDPEVEAYLAAVRDELGHLSEAERGDLLDDLALHLAEVADDDTDDPAGEGPQGLVARLGPPARYAAELRAAAGLPAPPAAGRSSGAGLRDAVIGSRAGRLARSAWRHPWTGATRDFVRQLRPAWWVLRGYLVVAVLLGPDLPLPRLGGSRFLGLVAVAGAVMASIAIGRRPKRLGARGLVVAFDVVLVLAALAGLDNVWGRVNQIAYVSGPAGFIPYQLSNENGPITNIYPYSRDGRPLDDVLLYDQDGRPLRPATQEWWADGCSRTLEWPRAADGAPVEFAYPQRYVLEPWIPAGACPVAPARPPVPLPAFPPAA